MGCTACYSACPKHCITMLPDEEGFLYPTASDACIDCGLCEKVCPLNNIKKNDTQQQTAYAAISKDYEVWHRSASGGAFSEIVRNWGDSDTLIVGAAWDGLKVHHTGVIGFDNITPLCKSKYVSSAIEDTFIEIKKHLRTGKKAIFCGCPCQIDGLRRFLLKDYDNLLTMDLICHGQGSPLVFQECMKVIGEQLGEEVVSYEFRTKRKIHESDYLQKITTTKGTHHVINDSYIQLFLSQDCLRPSCGENCKYRDARRPGDITIADCKGLTNFLPNLKPAKYNYSTIVCNTAKGHSVIPALSRTMKLYEHNIEEVIKYNPLFAQQTWFSQNRDTFFSQFIKNPQEAIKQNTKPLTKKKQDIRLFVKTITPTILMKLILKLKAVIK